MLDESMIQIEDNFEDIMIKTRYFEPGDINVYKLKNDREIKD